MSPNANAAVSPRPVRRAWARGARIVLAAGVALLLVQYLAGFVFLEWGRLAARRATPLTLTRYLYYHGANSEVRRRAAVSSAIAIGVVAVSALPTLWPRRRALHGDAGFARRREIVRAGLLGDRGVILGRLGQRCLMLDGQQGVALAAPPRSGKGVGVVVPNALNWPGSLVCIDIKKENWTLTAGYRQQCGQACYLFDPFAEDGQTARWNPFCYVSGNPMRRVNDLQRIAEMLYPDPPNVDPFWMASARSLFLGFSLYVFETPSLPKTVGEVLRQGMASDAEGFAPHWKRVIEERKRTPQPLSAPCVRALYDVIDLAPVTASSIRKTFTSRLDLWANPMLDAATAGNDFDLRTLRETPMSIYVGVNPDDLHRLRPVLSLFFQQAIGLQTRALPERHPQLKHQVMMLLDEFTALGRIPIIAESISYLPGYNVRVVLVIQTPAQLREVYGPNGAEIMLKSLAARIVFAPKDFGDAREISDELGFTTVRAKSHSKPAVDWFNTQSRRGRSVNVSEQRRALLLPQEVKELGEEEAIVFYEGLRPIRCRKIRYFEDARFRARLLPPPTRAAPFSSCFTPREALTAIDDRDAFIEGAATAPPAGSAVREATREATLEDIDRLDTLTLDHFAADFDRITVPAGRALSEQELTAAAEQFLQSMRDG